MKSFKRLLSVTALNVMVMYQSIPNKSRDSLKFRLSLVQGLMVADIQQ
jgi:hypothetical protein